MPIRVLCPGCGHVLNVPEQLAGRQGKCPQCASSVEVPHPAAPTRAAAPAPRVAPARPAPALDEGGSPAKPRGIRKARRGARATRSGAAGHGSHGLHAPHGLQAPHESPGAHSAHGAAGSGEVGPGTLAALAGTRPWTLLIAIVGLVYACGMALLGLLLLVVGSVAGGSPMVLLLIVAVQLVVPGLVAALSVILLGYSKRIAELGRTRTTLALDTALRAQQGAWRFLGILVIIVVVLAGGIIGLGAAAGLLAPASGGDEEVLRPSPAPWESDSDSLPPSALRALREAASE